MHRWLALLALAPVTSLAAVIAINEPWARPAAVGHSSEVFMELAVSEAATLVDVRTPVSTRVALADGRHQRSPPFALHLAAQVPMVMSERGTRIVLGRVDRTLKRGDRVPMTLVLRYADGTTQDIDVDVEVYRRSPYDEHRARRH